MKRPAASSPHPDPALDALLNALTQVEPAPDFTQRLTASLRGQATGGSVAPHASAPSAQAPHLHPSQSLISHTSTSLTPAAAVPAPAPDSVTGPAPHPAPSTGAPPYTPSSRPERAARSGETPAFPAASALLLHGAKPAGPGRTPAPHRRILPWLVTAVAASLLLVFLHPHSPTGSAPQPTLHPSATPQASAPAAGRQTPVIHLALTTRPARRSAPPLPAAPDPPNAEAQLDQQALEDLHAPSHPAPALPPTQQERLVALMLRRGERHDLAELEAGQREAYLRGERAAFTQFFDPPIDPAFRNQPRSLATQAVQTDPPNAPKE